MSLSSDKVPDKAMCAPKHGWCSRYSGGCASQAGNSHVKSALQRLQRLAGVGRSGFVSRDRLYWFKGWCYLEIHNTCVNVILCRTIEHDLKFDGSGLKRNVFT